MRERKSRTWDGEEMIFSDKTNCCAFNDAVHDNDNQMDYIGLHDKNGKEMYFDDICRFDNGDTFIIKQERWLECYGEWIGEPESEDQLRDFYRAERSEIIGNIYENPELCK